MTASKKGRKSHDIYLAKIIFNAFSPPDRRSRNRRLDGKLIVLLFIVSGVAQIRRASFGCHAFTISDAEYAGWPHGPV
jgi:hypothetical protein